MSSITATSSQMILCGAQMSMGELVQSYFPGLDEPTVLPFFETLTTRVAQAQRGEDLISTLVGSPVPGVWRWSHEIIAHLSSGGRTPVERIPLEFGLRRKVSEIVQRMVPIGPQDLWGEGDPRTQPVSMPRLAAAHVRDSFGNAIGEARIIAGTCEGDIKLRRPDGTILSAKTTRGGRSYQEDGIYMSWFVLPDGTEVKVIAGADGAGGMGGGDVASSAFLQGIHAGVVDAARSGRAPLAGGLYANGVGAVVSQKSRPDLPRARNATGAGSVIVIVGDQATIASSGDAMVLVAEPEGRDGFRPIGYTEVDSQGSKRAVITKGIDGAGGFHSYHLLGLKKGSRFVIGSDGLYENLIGNAYKDWGSSMARMIHNFPRPQRSVLAEFEKLLADTAGREDAAITFHDLALANIQRPGQKYPLSRRGLFSRGHFQLPAESDDDNIFAWSVEVGDVRPYPLQVPQGYASLEPIVS